MNDYFDRSQSGSLEWLLSLDDVSFVEKAFEVILGRHADRIGIEHYTSLLERKRDRLQVISDLYHSKEAAMRPQRQDIAEAVFRHKHPVRSRIMKAFQPERYIPSSDTETSAPPSPSPAAVDVPVTHGMDAVQYQSLFDAIHGKGNALQDQIRRLSYRLDGAQAVETDEILGDGNARYLFNISTSNHWRSHPVGIIRVEREMAAYMRRFRNVDYVLWDVHSQSLKRLDRVHTDRILAPEWCEPDSAMAPYDPVLMPEAVIRSEDTYISMGLDWDLAPTSQVLKYLKRSGAKSILTCFDTVPVQFPELLVRDEIAQEFRQHLIEMAHGASKVWAISQATKNDLSRFWQSAEMERELPEIVTVPLASYADTTLLPILESGDHAIMRDVFSKGDYVLYVSSVEPRKNHKLLFDIWRDLWNERGRDCPQLVFVGNVGWGCADTMQRVPRMAAYIGGKINGLQRVSDNLLQHIYHNCVFSVFPSIYEGWGLAATEAMQHGKICVVANTSSLSEATQNLMPALHPFDFPGWKAEIERLLDDQPYRQSLESKIAEQYHPLSWNDVGKSFCNKLILENQQ